MQTFICIHACVAALTFFGAFPADACWSPYWFGAGWCGGGEDASLLPFWEQRHFSQQVWILQPTWENQHQPDNPQVRPRWPGRKERTSEKRVRFKGDGSAAVWFQLCWSEEEKKASLNRKLSIKKSAVSPLVSNNLPHAFWINALFVCSLSQIAEGSSRVCLHSQEQTGASGQLPGGRPWCLLLFGGLSQTFRSHSEMMSSCGPNRADCNGA